MKNEQPFILENNFEKIAREPLIKLLEKYEYTAITVVLTGDYSVIYRRFTERNSSPDRHRGHVVNDCYPEKSAARAVVSIAYEAFVKGITEKGMDSFTGNGPCIVVDTTDFSKMEMQQLIKRIEDCRKEILND